MKNKTTRPKCYLAGRMSLDDPRDKQWREDITPFLNKKLEFKVLNPYLLEPAQLRGLRPGRLPSKTPDGKPVKHWYDLRFFPTQSHEYQRFLRYMRAIIDYDLNIVDKTADIILVRWSDGCSTGAGTHAEVSLARRGRKPVYLINETKDTVVPAWILGCCNEVFNSMEELQKFLMDEYGKDTDNKDMDISNELIN